MHSNDLINHLKLSVNQNLPAFKAHYLMMPKQRREEFEKNKPDDFTKKSAVLLLLSHRNNQLNLTFIKRQKYDGVHSGQIAFPGGKFEKNDITLIETALRETYEEIGIKPLDVEIIGQLSELYIPPSNFLVQPVLGYFNREPIYKINNYEVESVFEVSIEELLSAETIHDADFEVINNKIIKAPCYIFGEHKVWGATSMILSELIEIAKNFNGLDLS